MSPDFSLLPGCVFLGHLSGDAQLRIRNISKTAIDRNMVQRQDEQVNFELEQNLKRCIALMWPIT